MAEMFRVVAKPSAYKDNDPVQKAFGEIDETRGYPSQQAAEAHAENLSNAGDRSVYLQGANGQDTTNVDAYLVSRNPPDHRFESIRTDILERDDYTCQECGTEGESNDGSLDVHHITPRSQGGSNDPENLKTLCRDCHQFFHAEQSRRGTIQELQGIVERYDEWHIQPSNLEDLADEYTESSRFSGVQRKLVRLADRWDALFAIRTTEPALFIYVEASESSEYRIPDQQDVYPIIGYWDTAHHRAIDTHSGSRFQIHPTPLLITSRADDEQALIFPTHGFANPPAPKDCFVCEQCSAAFGYATVEQDNVSRPRFQNPAPPRVEQRQQHKFFFCENRIPPQELLEDPDRRAAFSRALVRARDPCQPTNVERVISALLDRKSRRESDEDDQFADVSGVELARDIDGIDPDTVDRALYCIQTGEGVFSAPKGSVIEYLNLGV